MSATTASASDPDHQAYRIVSGNSAMPVSDPRFQRVASFTRAALSTHGLFEAQSPATADLEIAVSFEMLPARSETRFQSLESTTRVPEVTQTVKKTVELPDGTKQKVEEKVVVPSHTVSQTTMTPMLVSIYPKVLRIVAVEARPRAPGAPAREVWRVTVKNEDENADLEASLPLMVAAAMDHLGVELPVDTIVRLSERDSRVRLVVDSAAP